MLEVKVQERISPKKTSCKDFSHKQLSPGQRVTPLPYIHIKIDVSFRKHGFHYCLNGSPFAANHLKTVKITNLANLLQVTRVKRANVLGGPAQ